MASAQYPPTIFVLGTQQHVGKTVTCIGVIAKLLSPEYGYCVEQIGYIKPVGQQTVTVKNAQGHPLYVDKDAVLVTSLLGIPIPRYEVISPVLWLGGLTASYIDDQASETPQMPNSVFAQRVREAYEEVAQGKEVVIVEGTGQPGVGSVGSVCNGDIIRMLREMGVPLYVLLVVEAGIGSTIDRLFPYLIAMDRLGAYVDGIIVNRVFPERMEKIVHYLTTYYQKVFPRQYGHLLSHSPPSIVGFVPMVPQLRRYSMRLIAQMFAEENGATVEILAPPHFEEVAGRLIRNIKTINVRFGYDRFVESDDAIVVGINANDIILSALLLHERLKRLEGTGLSGLILSSSQIGGLSSHVLKLIAEEGLPTIALPYDSAEIIQKIESWTVKIQPYDTEKHNLIAATYCEHLDLARVFSPSRAPS